MGYVTKMQKADARERLQGTGKAGDPGWPNDEREQVIRGIYTSVKGKVYVHETKREIQTYHGYRHVIAEQWHSYVYRRIPNKNRNRVYPKPEFLVYE